MRQSIFAFLVVFLVAVFQASAAFCAYEKPYIGEMQSIRTEYEDTFVHLARDYGLGYVELRSANPTVDPWIPGDGTRLTLPSRHILPDAPREGVVINLPEMRLYIYDTKDGPPKTFPIGVGREGLDTPVGETKIVRKTVGPDWRPTARMRKEDPELPAVVPAGPENPLGTHAVYLGWPTYAIHGTNRPFGIGRRISSGCIRLYPTGIKEFYELASVGMKVTVVDQPLKLAWIDDRLYLEAHTTMEQSIRMEEHGAVQSAELTSEEEALITKFAGDSAEKIRWAAVRTAVRERKGYPIEIARRSFGTKAGAYSSEDDSDDEELKESRALAIDGEEIDALESAALEPAAGKEILRMSWPRHAALPGDPGFIGPIWIMGPVQPPMAGPQKPEEQSSVRDRQKDSLRLVAAPSANLNQ